MHFNYFSTSCARELGVHAYKSETFHGQAFQRLGNLNGSLKR